MSDMADEGFDYEYEDWPSGGEDNNDQNEDEIIIGNTFCEAEDNMIKNPKEALT
jgi:COP9 signalosome complex subunit 2